MSSVPEPVSLNNHHRDTLLRLFQHPTSHNIEWLDVASLLAAVGTIEEHREGKFEVRLANEVRFLDRPKHKDIDVQMVVDLRHMLTAAGYRPEVDRLVDKGVED
ncbi:MAG: hypothetical protein PXZ08_05745 [Actinomycetota bacterium]|jgi:hypothetical protein|nr:hypothetical protein [Actinomycetota bacterium]